MLTGEEIRRARQRAGWSQEELAERVGSTYRTVGNWERGKTRPDQKETVLRSVLSRYWDADVHQSVPLTAASDIELLGELARRLGRSQSIEQGKVVRSDEQRTVPMKQAGDEPATEDDEKVHHQTFGGAPEDEEEPVAAEKGHEGIGPDELPETT
ncbi:helix-turn-helix transcriptional regulator [Nesterenkonia ebinurensis]|uniref:helix-turn-helix transcriptional regulator n=1 Tax=Nesterenkonia ebinurensis TaxID=2608252 RepID=UPI00123DB940|nr:helix-turn-helix transcriptional regulator [Nesterenkonia ebinurensis]